MAINRPKTYQNFVPPDTGKAYQISANADGTSQITDVTEYVTEGDNWSATDANKVWDQFEALTAADINAVNKAGDTMTGTFAVENSDPRVHLKNNNIDSRFGVFELDANAALHVSNWKSGDTTGLKLQPTSRVSLAQALQLVINGSNSYDLFGAHNKPTGSYTGNGSATSRTISVGGIGEILVIYTGGRVGFVGYNGGVIFNYSEAKATYFTEEQINFRAGVLTLASDNTQVNTNGTIYNYYVQ